MKTAKISLNSIDKVKAFVNEISKFDCDFDLVSGRYVIDAKSIMGIFSLDLSKPIDLNIHADGAALDSVMEIIDDFMQSLSTFPLFYWISITSAVLSAASISSSIFSASFSSDLRITFRFGFVTGCFATKIVQQSSYGRTEVS